MKERGCRWALAAGDRRRQGSHVRFDRAAHSVRLSWRCDSYLSAKLDDPTFAAPIFANLFDDEGGETFSLIWSRSNRRNGD